MVTDAAEDLASRYTAQELAERAVAFEELAHRKEEQIIALRRRLVDDHAVYAAAKLHASRRGINLAEWPNQQALVPDELRWMREAVERYLDVVTEEAPNVT